MKTLRRLLAAATVAAFIATPAFAKECCDATSAKVKKGEACEMCAEHACCKEAAKKTAASVKTKIECKTCAAKKEKKTS